MPVNRNALIRYKTIDKCLQNRYRKWTLEDLIDACSDALYEYEGIDKGVSRRTVQADIQVMRSDKLGYNAPIIVEDKKYYTYEDPNYSITNIPLTESDLGMLSEAVEFMKQFKGFSHFRELEGMVQKLEDHIYSHQTQTKPVIDFDKNENLKGLEFLNPIYQAIIKKEALKITYQSFKARQPQTFDFHGYVLKEFRNRWFLIGRRANQATIMNLALDRMLSVEKSNIPYQEDSDFDSQEYFSNTIGVSVLTTKAPEEVKLFVHRHHAPYVLTKPIHPSQKLIQTDYYGVTISLNVHHNYELEKEILAFGDAVQVISPISLKNKIKERLHNSIDWYQTELNEKGLAAALLKLHYKGFALLNHIYTKREIKNLGQHFQRISKQHTGDINLIEQTPTLLNFILNRNILQVVKKIIPQSLLVEATLEMQQPQDWKQQKAIPIQKGHILSKDDLQKILDNALLLEIVLDKDSSTYEILPGSHQKILSTKDQKVIIENSFPNTTEVLTGGALLCKPLLLRQQKQNDKKSIRILRLFFVPKELGKELPWQSQKML